VRNSYAKIKGYIRCECCSSEIVDSFLQNCPDEHHVDHIIQSKYGGKHCLNNLQYLDIKTHCLKSARESGVVKLDEVMVIEIRELIYKGYTLTSIAEKYKVSDTAISHIKSKSTWRHVK